MSKHAIRDRAGQHHPYASQMARVGEATRSIARQAALLGLAKGMALDHAADGIRVNTLSRGHANNR
jgi:NAD(P)-dependent dehydrogenase (short-subunit alcohol dehydrogenase family)